MWRSTTMIIFFACFLQALAKPSTIWQEDGVDDSIEQHASQDKLVSEALQAVPHGAPARRLGFFEQFNQFLQPTTTTTTTRMRKAFKPPEIDRRVVGGALAAGAATLIAPNILSAQKKFATTTTKPQANLGGILAGATIVGAGGYAIISGESSGDSSGDSNVSKILKPDSSVKQETAKVQTPTITPKEWINSWEARLSSDEDGSKTPPGTVGAIPTRISHLAWMPRSRGRLYMPSLRLFKMSAVVQRPSPALLLSLFGVIVGSGTICIALHRRRGIFTAGEERLLAAD